MEGKACIGPRASLTRPDQYVQCSQEKTTPPYPHRWDPHSEAKNTELPKMNQFPKTYWPDWAFCLGKCGIEPVPAGGRRTVGSPHWFVGRRGDPRGGRSGGSRGSRRHDGCLVVMCLKTRYAPKLSSGFGVYLCPRKSLPPFWGITPVFLGASPFSVGFLQTNDHISIGIHVHTYLLFFVC